MGVFCIDAYNLEWIDGSRDCPEDFCLHGHAVAVIGGQKLEYDAAISAAALYLLKTLTENHTIGTDNPMLPCCGHSIFADEAMENVTIVGCPNGIDWSVIHKGEFVNLILSDGACEQIHIEDYRKEVYRFADKVEAFYNSCSPKRIEDEFDREQYNVFWKEWHRRRGNS